jgi:hypothetical protein
MIEPLRPKVRDQSVFYLFPQPVLPQQVLAQFDQSFDFWRLFLRVNLEFYRLPRHYWPPSHSVPLRREAFGAQLRESLLRQ